MAVRTITSAERAEHFRQATRALIAKGTTDQLRRHWGYVRQTSDDTVPKTALTVLVTGAAVGGYAGKKMGEGVAARLESRSPHAEVIEFMGMVFGVAGGLVLATFGYMAINEYAPGFRTWTKKSLQYAIETVITAHYGNDPVLSDTLFTCSLSLGIILDPCISPTGTAYNYEFLTESPKDEQGWIIDPKRNPAFPIEKVKPWYELGFITNKRVLSLLQKDLAELGEEKDPTLREALTTRIAEFKLAADHYYEKAEAEILVQKKNQKWSGTEYQAKITEFYELFGDSSEADINWIQDWPKILKARLNPSRAINIKG